MPLSPWLMLLLPPSPLLTLFLSPPPVVIIVEVAATAHWIVANAFSADNAVAAATSVIFFIFACHLLATKQYQGAFSADEYDGNKIFTAAAVHHHLVIVAVASFLPLLIAMVTVGSGMIMLVGTSNVRISYSTIYVCSIFM